MLQPRKVPPDLAIGVERLEFEPVSIVSCTKVGHAEVSIALVYILCNNRMNLAINKKQKKQAFLKGMHMRIALTAQIEYRKIGVGSVSAIQDIHAAFLVK